MSLNWITQNSPEYNSYSQYQASDSFDGYTNHLGGQYDWTNQLPFLQSLGYDDQSAFNYDMSESGGGVPSMRPEVLERLNRDGYEIGVMPTGTIGNTTSILQRGREVSPQYRHLNAYNDPGFNLASSMLIGAIAPGGWAVGGSGAGLGAAAGYSGGTATAIDAGVTAGMMSAGSGNSDKDTLRAIATSGGLGAMGNTGEAVGLSGNTAQIFDGAVKGGLNAAINEGNIGQGAFMGALPAAAAGIGGMFSPDTSYQPTRGDLGFLNDVTQSSRVPNTTQVSRFSDSAPQSYAPAYSFPGATGVPQQTSEEGGFEMPGFQEFFNRITPKTPQQWGSLAEGLLGMYSGYRQRRDARNLRQGIGANRDAYRTELARKLQRRDAASGRRSNYAGRDTQLQAALAELDSRNMPGMLSLQNQELGGLAQLFQSGLRTAGKLGAFGPENVPGYQTPSNVPSSSYLMSTAPQAPISYSNMFEGSRFGDSYLARRNLLGGG